MRILRPYQSTEPVSFPLWDVTGGDFNTSDTLVAGDVQVSTNGGAFVNVANLPSNSSGQVQWTPTSGEMTGKSIRLRVRDQSSPALWTAQLLMIETYGHASALHPALGVAAPTTTAIRDALLSWEPYTGYSLARLLRVMGIVLRGTGSGLNTTTAVYTAPAGSATVTATVDANGNRSAVSDDASGTP